MAGKTRQSPRHARLQQLRVLRADGRGGTCAAARPHRRAQRLRSQTASGAERSTVRAAPSAAPLVRGGSPRTGLLRCPAPHSARRD
ncbi:hypothetical protein T492DRAFT_1071819 [Pavlovales sp. CCMP2436]|nr:hypothetical protein T492DRAFT_1071819 [Pavlovales sp. CCMP2436]